ncbi:MULTISPECIES: endonuclease/exonuclease/phosphatase family protein [unclassified Thioalkalivibrio]|uniref:endonuclease/exonuclease/phosphatase family protein n=1 Tax=unclassified Thioalkalivibrio TaxID=2621013 RepID=UPI000195A914|nr:MULTISPECIES: endonuclease/exonuclease/phosphatase family protein [unclassified Thioalkalivibrio]ADC70552.1 Endonuclease/exonuclease/phosphatase [Thioalkalivibrio sp. K90mix]
MTATASGKHAEPVRAQPASPEVRGLTYQHDQGAQRLRLLSFNAQVGIPSSRLHHYLTNSWKHVLPYKGRIGNLDRVARFISDFDIVGVQELDGGSLRSNFVDLASYLSEKARFPHTYNRINRNLGQFAKHSLALFSRLEPERVEMHRLPGPLPGRGAIEARYAMENGEELVLFLLHLALGRRARQAQLDYVAERIQSERHAVVMGDLNCQQDSLEIRRLVARTGLLEPISCPATYPSWDPRLVFDHILLTPDLHVSDMRVYNVALSDHLPVGIEIELPAAQSLHGTRHTA